MASIFRKDDNYVEKPNRNVFPKTYESNLTTKFGQIIPAFCRPVMIGETVKIDPQMNFNFLPLVFPIQNRVRASLSFYYVRNRNLWKDWMDFQFKMKDGLVPPYHVFREETYRELLRVGGLLDHLGVPVVLHGDYDVVVGTPPLTYLGKDGYSYDPITGTWSKSVTFQTLNTTPNITYTGQNGNVVIYEASTAFVEGQYAEDAVQLRLFKRPIAVSKQIKFNVTRSSDGDTDVLLLCNRYVQADVTISRSAGTDDKEDLVTSATPTRSSQGTANTRQNGGTVSRRGGQTSTDTSVQTSVRVVSTQTFKSDNVVETCLVKFSDVSSVNSYDNGMNIFEILGYVTVPDSIDFLYDYDLEIPVNVKEAFGTLGVPLSELALHSLPFPFMDSGDLVDDDNKLHISSMPARAVESIYNAFIRNETNNPFMLNGQPEYNKYLRSVEGGADSEFYPLYKRNWQDDCFTTALHSPQHGVAPLVGLRSSESDPGSITLPVVFENSDGTITQLGLQTDYDGFVTAVTTPYANDEYTRTLAKALMDGVTNFGMSINDFRNVNSYQRWLENNVRKGYKYPDQIKAHTGVSVKYNILDMPEYIGGMSRDMNVNTVVQTTENDYGNLGDFSGQAWIEGNMEHSIEHFCDEEGFIIGLLSVDPVAPYSQVIPKYLLRENAFDYYSHEFGKIGMQPILNREIAPLQSYYEGNSEEVFGYQRAWYDSLDGLSEVHGKFRTDFRNFIINRTFESVPQLGEDFLTMSDDDINNVFYVDDGEDKILGQILFRYESIMPIPMYGIPALE